MNKLIVITVLMCISLVGHSQTLAEWFNQKQTQKKYLLQQIAALQVYIGYAKKGYDIAQKGLNTIGNLSKSEFDQHQDHINSLTLVNPTIRRSDQVTQTIEIYQKIKKDYPITFSQIQGSQSFAQAELEYIMKVFTRLNSDNEATVRQLELIISDGSLEMKDNERMQRIEDLYKHMQGNYAFYKKFSGETKMLALQRSRERNDIETSRVLHGITGE